MANAAHDDVVHVWFMDTTALTDEAAREGAAVLSAAENARAARFHFERDRRDYIAAHALVRRALATLDGRPPASLAFGTGEHGKPFLLAADGAPSKRAFSLSHAHGMVACAAAARPVGIDVERLDRRVDVDTLARHVCSAAEIERLDRLEPAGRREHFIDLWTLKEALLKAAGVGVSFPMHQIAFDIRTPDAIVLSAPATLGSDAWAFRLFAPGPRYRLAVAVRRQRSAAVAVRFMRADHSIPVPAVPFGKPIREFLA